MRASCAILKLVVSFDGKNTELKQPVLFKNYIKQNVDTARGADADANLRTFKNKYGPNHDAFRGLTQEIAFKAWFILHFVQTAV